jgi:hypothetical protein
MIGEIAESMSDWLVSLPSQRVTLRVPDVGVIDSAYALPESVTASSGRSPSFLNVFMRRRNVEVRVEESKLSQT